jgi:hypothetical protein
MLRAKQDAWNITFSKLAEIVIFFKMKYLTCFVPSIPSLVRLGGIVMLLW